jgi:hypothetical protein
MDEMLLNGLEVAIDVNGNKILHLFEKGVEIDKMKNPKNPPMPKFIYHRTVGKERNDTWLIAFITNCTSSLSGSREKGLWCILLGFRPPPPTHTNICRT